MCCYSHYSANRHYLRSPVGCLKCLNIIFGIISLILLTATFTDFTNFEDDFCLAIVLICLVLSTLYFIAYIAFQDLRYIKANRRLDRAYHLVSGLLLILAGIDFHELVSKSESGCFASEQYFEPGYVKGAAKIFIFINGVIYGIIGSMRAKGENALDFDEGAVEEERLLCRHV